MQWFGSLRNGHEELGPVLLLHCECGGRIRIVTCEGETFHFDGHLAWPTILSLGGTIASLPLSSISLTCAVLAELRGLGPGLWLCCPRYMRTVCPFLRLQRGLGMGGMMRFEMLAKNHIWNATRSIIYAFGWLVACRMHLLGSINWPHPDKATFCNQYQGLERVCVRC